MDCRARQAHHQVVRDFSKSVVHARGPTFAPRRSGDLVVFVCSKPDPTDTHVADYAQGALRFASYRQSLFKPHAGRLKATGSTGHHRHRLVSRKRTGAVAQTVPIMSGPSTSSRMSPIESTAMSFEVLDMLFGVLQVRMARFWSSFQPNPTGVCANTCF